VTPGRPDCQGRGVFAAPRRRSLTIGRAKRESRSILRRPVGENRETD
jgi:hypothetical protein